MKKETLLNETSLHGIDVLIEQEDNSNLFQVTIHNLKDDASYQINIDQNKILDFVEEGKKMDDTLEDIIKVCDKEYQVQQEILAKQREIEDQKKLSKLLSLKPNSLNQEKTDELIELMDSNKYLCDWTEDHSKKAIQLVREGADVNAKDRDKLNYTPLMYVSFDGSTELIKLLLDNGADVNAKNESGVTPIMIASINGYLDTVELLIDNGADVNAKNESGVTPIMIASNNGCLSTVELLIDNGANLYAKNNTGQTALDIAKEEGHTDVVEFIEVYQSSQENDNNSEISLGR